MVAEVLQSQDWHFPDLNLHNLSFARLRCLRDWTDHLRGRFAEGMLFPVPDHSSICSVGATQISGILGSASRGYDSAFSIMLRSTRLEV